MAGVVARAQAADFGGLGGGTIPRLLLLVRRRSSAISPDSEIHLLDAGHFALDERNDDIARVFFCTFLAKHSV